MSPFFSICIPTFNGSRYIAKAISSVLSQTYDNFELIIYNNGSNDETSDIINSFHDERILIFEEEKCISKAIPAWSKCMSLATGKYILMLGDDDWFEPDFMEQSYYYINKFNLDIFSIFSTKNVCTRFIKFKKSYKR